MRHLDRAQPDNAKLANIANLGGNAGAIPAGIDLRSWKRADDAPAGRCLQGAVALEMVFVTRNRRPHFADSDLATCALDRALDEEETLAASVRPDRICWLVTSWPGAGRLRSFLVQTAEYAEIYGAPVGGVWQRGFWYRPIPSREEAVLRSEAIARMPGKSLGWIDR